MPMNLPHLHGVLFSPFILTILLEDWKKLNNTLAITLSHNTASKTKTKSLKTKLACSLRCIFTYCWHQWRWKQLIFTKVARSLESSYLQNIQRKCANYSPSMYFLFIMWNGKAIKVMTCMWPSVWYKMLRASVAMRNCCKSVDLMKKGFGIGKFHNIGNDSKE